MTSVGNSPTPGKVDVLAPGLRRILAPNPSPMTFWGTNTYLIGREKLVIIDPGPDSAAHLKAILGAVGSTKVHFILVTHAHLDHTPLAKRLGAEVNAPVLAYGDCHAGRSAVMQRLASEGLTDGGEGIDRDFQPDQIVSHGEVFASNEWYLEVMHTPGHMGNHIALRWDKAIFSGDLVMGWASSLVSPPDGDLDDFLASCEALKARGPEVLYPAHGAPVNPAIDRIDWLIEHRKDRTADILSALAVGARSVDDLTAEIYKDTPKELHPAAARNILAHLISLNESKLVRAKPKLGRNATYQLMPIKS